MGGVATRMRCPRTYAYADNPFRLSAFSIYFLFISLLHSLQYCSRPSFELCKKLNSSILFSCLHLAHTFMFCNSGCFSSNAFCRFRNCRSVSQKLHLRFEHISSVIILHPDTESSRYQTQFLLAFFTVAIHSLLNSLYSIVSNSS